MFFVQFKYIGELEISLSFLPKVDFLDQNRTYRETHEISGFSIEGVSPPQTDYYIYQIVAEKLCKDVWINNVQLISTHLFLILILSIIFS